MTTDIVTECGASNMKALSEFAKEIYEHLRSANVAWRAVAACLSQADEQYKFGSEEFRQLLKQVGFSKATASKLIEIDRNHNLQRHPELLNLTNAWTVLYEITTLSDWQFAQFIECLSETRTEKNLLDNRNRVLTASFVKSFKTIGEKTTNHFRTLVSIGVDVDALRACRFDGSDFAEMKGILRQLSDIPYIKLVQSSAIEDQEARFLSDYEKEHDRVLREMLREKRDEYEKLPNSEWRSWHFAKSMGNGSVRKKPTTWAGLSWEEIVSMWNSYKYEPTTEHEARSNDRFYGPNGVCDLFGVERITSQMVDARIRDNIAKKQTKVVERLNERPKFPTPETFWEGITTPEEDERTAQESLDLMKKLMPKSHRARDLSKFNF